MSLSGTYDAGAGAGADGPAVESVRAAVGVTSAIAATYRSGVTGWPDTVVASTPDAAAVNIIATAVGDVLPSTPANGGMRNASLTRADTDSPALTLINGLAASTV